MNTNQTNAVANSSTNPRFLNLKFFYIVIINSVFYGIMRYLNAFEFFTQFGKSFLLDLCVLFALCALLAKLPQRFAQKAINYTLNALFTLSFIVGIVNIFLLLNFNSTLNIASFEIFLASNLREAWEFSAFYANTKSIVWLLAFIAISVFCVLYKRSFVAPKALNAIIVIAAVVFLCVGAVKFIQNKNLNFIAKHFTNKTEICQFAKVIYKGFVAEDKIIAEFRTMDKKLEATLQLAKGNLNAKTQTGGGEKR